MIGIQRISWRLPRNSAGHGRHPGPYWSRYSQRRPTWDTDLL